MAKCEICEKSMNVAKKHVYRSSYVTKRTLRKQHANLQKIHIIISGVPKRVYVCTKCLKAQKVEK